MVYREIPKKAREDLNRRLRGLTVKLGNTAKYRSSDWKGESKAGK